MKEASKTHSTLWKKFHKDPQEREEQQLQCNSPKNCSINFLIYNVHPLSPKFLLYKKQPSKKAVTHTKVQERLFKMEGKMLHRTRQQGFYICLGHSQHNSDTRERNCGFIQKLHWTLVVWLALGYCKAMKYERAPPSKKKKLKIKKISHMSMVLLVRNYMGQRPIHTKGDAKWVLYLQ